LPGEAVHGFIHQHFEIRPDHLVPISLRRLVVTAGFPHTGESGGRSTGFDAAVRPIITPSQPVSATMAMASSGVRMSPLPTTGIFTASFYRGNPFPACIAAVSLFRACGACSATPFRPQSAAILARGTQTMFFVVPAKTEFHGKRNLHGGTHSFKDRAYHRQVFEQAGTAVALDHAAWPDSPD